MAKSNEANLGNGWMAKLHSDVDGVEVLVLRNAENGNFINLPPESVKLLRGIFDATVSKKAA